MSCSCSIPFSEDTPDRGAADIKAAGDFGLADAGTMKFPDLTCPLSDSHGPTQMLALQSRFGNARADTLTEDLVLEVREHGQKASHGAARRRRQIERFSERYESHAQFRQFF
jgi:hypothetical protein